MDELRLFGAQCNSLRKVASVLNVVCMANLDGEPCEEDAVKC